MRHNGFDALIGFIRRGIRGREYTGGVENIQALVFHGTHVEVFYGNDHKDVEIVLPAKPLFVPAHGTLEYVHGVATLSNIVGFGKNLQLDLSARHCCKRVLQHR